MNLLMNPFDDPSNLTHYRGAPRITSPPPADSPLVYNEDEIVAIVTDIFKHFVSILYIEPELVAFPPEDTGRHVLDRRYLSDELLLSDRVIALLERLPYIGKREGEIRDYLEWYPQSIVTDYRSTERARETRDAAGLSWIDPDCNYTTRTGPDIHFMRPTDIALGYPVGYGGQHIILDTEANSIRLFHNIELPPVPDGLVRNFDAARNLLLLV